MKKIAIFMLGIAITSGSFAAVEEIKVSGSLETMMVNVDADLGSSATDATARFLIGVTKLRFDSDLSENVSSTVELFNERVWGASQAASAVGSTVMDVNLAFVTMKDFLGMPAKFILGRQQMVIGSGLILRGGNEATVFDDQGLTEPFTKKSATDGARLIFDYDPLTFDFFYQKVYETDINVRDDVDVYGVDAKYDINDKSSVNVYAFFNDKSLPTNPDDDKQHLAVYGIHGKSELNDNINVWGEYAFMNGDVRQSATKHTRKKAFLFDAGLNYKFNDEKNSYMGLEYMYTSGDKNPYDSDDNSWAKLLGGCKVGTASDLFTHESSNLQVFKLSGGFEPVADISIKAAYQYITLARVIYDTSSSSGFQESYTDLHTQITYDVNGSNRELGQSIDTLITYDYTEDVEFCLYNGFFFPGQYYGSKNSQTAYGTKASVKVSF